MTDALVGRQPIMGFELQKRMSAVRIGTFLFTMKAFSTILSIVVCIVLCNIEVTERMSYPQFAIIVVITANYMLSLAVTYGDLHLADWVVDAFHYVNMAALIIRIAFVQHSLYFFTFSGTRIVQRLFLSLPLLDLRKALWTNAVFSLTVCFAYSRNCDVLHGIDSQPTMSPTNHTIWFVVNEALALFCILFATFLAEQVSLGNAWASVEASILQRVQRAALRLLSVVCDAQVHISADFQMTCHSLELLSLLCPDPRRDPATLDGRSFLDYVADHEHQRLRDFMCPSPPPSESEDRESEETGEAGFRHEPPASIPITLKSSSGAPVPVELFCVFLPDAGNRPGHLVGIRQVGIVSMETAVDAPGVVGLSIGAGCVEARQPPADAPPGMSQTATCAEEVLRVGSQTHGEEPSETSSESSMSKGMHEYHHVDSVTLTVDISDQRLLVEGLSLHFAQEGRAAVDNATILPSLADWLSEAQAARMVEWAQSNANAWNHGRTDRLTDYGPLQLCNGKGAFMCAASVVVEPVHAEEEEEEKEEEEEEKEEEDQVKSDREPGGGHGQPRPWQPLTDGSRSSIQVALRLRGISKVLWPPQGGLPRRLLVRRRAGAGSRVPTSTLSAISELQGQQGAIPTHAPALQPACVGELSASCTLSAISELQGQQGVVPTGAPALHPACVGELSASRTLSAISELQGQRGAVPTHAPALQPLAFAGDTAWPSGVAPHLASTATASASGGGACQLQRGVAATVGSVSNELGAQTEADDAEVLAE